MSKTRFSQSMVLVCIAAVAACTSTGSDEGPAGNTELNVVTPDAEGTDIQSVEYTICCMGNSTVFLDNDASFDDGVCINGNVEVIEAVPPEAPGIDMTNAQVRQGYMDLAPGPCTVELRARDNDGEVICTDQEPFTVVADTTNQVDVLMICGLSFQADVGSELVIGDFSYEVANFCPDLFVLNCLESMPTGDPATTTCEVRYRDGDSQCGQTCDPQTCTPVLDGPNGEASGLDCQPATDPGVSTDILCDAGTITACLNGTIHSDGSCTFTGDQLGTLVPDTNGNQVVPNPATFDVSCAGAAPGATITCMARTTDGDLDCDKTKMVTFDCPGLDPCDAAADPPDCTLTGGDCVNEVCDSSGGTAMCVFDSNVPAGGGNNCDYQGVPGQPGECDGNGNCAQFGCSTPDDCDDDNECTVPPGGACDTGTGICCDGVCDDELVNKADGTPCSSGTGQCESPSGGNVTNDSVCVDSCTLVGPTACDDGAPNGECTSNVCTSADGLCGDGGAGLCANGDACTDDLDCLCSNPPITDCDACCDSTGGGANTENCRAGVCTPPPPAATCDPTGQGNVVACQSPELLALDCFLLGSGAPLILDPVITPTAPAFAGVPLAVVPVQVLNLPASLVCGFSSVLTTASILNSEANVDIFGATETGYLLDSWLDPADPFGGANRTTGHDPTTFDFIAGCGKQFGACGFGGNVGFCNGGNTACTSDLDCAGTGPGVVVPFISDSAGGTSPGPQTLTPSAPGAVVFSYGYDDLQAYVETSLGVLCLGAPAVAAPPAAGCGFICVAGDRNGDSVPSIGRGAIPGTGSGNPNPTIDPLDSPRVIYDTDCDKLGVAACGGTACDNVTEFCPLAPFGQTCDTTVGVCNPAPVGPGIPVCCDDIPGGQAFFDFSQASNVCATGQPGSDIAATEAPCNGESGTSTGGLRCEGAVTCGNCQQVTGPAPGGVFTPGVDCPESTPGCAGPPNTCDLCPWPTVEFCSASPLSGALGTCDSDENLKCPNGDSDCTGSATVPADEDFCVVPCAVNVCATGDRIGDTCLRDIDCQRCTGGGNDNGNCTSDAQCPGACDIGFDAGLSCLADTDCRGFCEALLNQTPPVLLACSSDAECSIFGPCVEIGTCGAPGVCDANTGTCPIVGCDSDSCCDYMQTRFPNAVGPGVDVNNPNGQFPLLPVNPAP